jgi:hypothetical protein
MRRSHLGWALLGFVGTLLLAWGVSTVWPEPGKHTEISIHRTQRIVLEQPGRPDRHLARGGDALQPASAGQQPAPAPAGNQGGIKTPNHEGGTTSPPPGSSEPPLASTPPAAQPVSAPQPASSPAPAPAPALEVSPEPPGLLSPAITTVCSIADQLAHLC